MPRLKPQNMQPVFVVGAARSGTTLIQSLITSIPGFFSCPETHFFDELMAGGPVCGGYQLHRPKLKYLKERVSEKCLLDSFAKVSNGFLKIPARTQEALLVEARAGVLSPGKYLCTLMESCSTAHDEHSNRWVEKTPVHASYLEQIFGMFPAAQIVCVQRNSAGVLSSAASTFGVPVCIVALDYYRTYCDVKHFLAHHPDRAKQVFFISYDEVICADEPVEELLRFLSVENIQPDAVRRAAKNKFHELYGDSLMKAIQPKMAADPSCKISVSAWKSKAIQGYTSLLDCAHLPPGGTDGNPNTGYHSYIIPMAVDSILGLVYITRWRARWLLSILKNLLLLRSVSR